MRIKSVPSLAPLLFAILAALIVSCGGPDAGSCESAANLVCDRACECTGGGECQVVEGPATSTYGGESDCRFFLREFVCPDEDGNDFTACEVALDTAACVPTAEGIGLELPAECAPF